MRSRFFFVYLFSALFFLFSCNAFFTGEEEKTLEDLDKKREKLNFTDEQRLKVLDTIKSQLNSDSKKIARVDEYFRQLEDSKRDVILQVFSIGFEYISFKEAESTKSENRKANLDALKIDFESKLKHFNYTEEDFDKLVEDFNKFIESSV
ncbi:hypothetical protein QIA25_00415 (plasmid) [Borreliella spielmanii]|uniref:Uncharacterized protein n=2 Tax=Borreliella spielmanii TaxID=88916 RepID=C0RC37_9SPIR|nr:hypothetical protein [Borreliella spielmanii]ACN53324.1 conserved hypothetical protein [Borreliella spielmanii A14S]MBB6031877.1 hypothetical protein [Borreliella spielmanii]WKC83069.1 hypothetical protein QIA25_00415 [Borreliella spielmanii]